jgi:hypothetical protein
VARVTQRLLPELLALLDWAAAHQLPEQVVPLATRIEGLVRDLGQRRAFTRAARTRTEASPVGRLEPRPLPPGHRPTHPRAVCRDSPPSSNRTPTPDHRTGPRLAGTATDPMHADAAPRGEVLDRAAPVPEPGPTGRAPRARRCPPRGGAPTARWPAGFR